MPTRIDVFHRPLSPRVVTVNNLSTTQGHKRLVEGQHIVACPWHVGSRRREDEHIVPSAGIDGFHRVFFKSKLRQRESINSAGTLVVVFLGGGGQLVHQIHGSRTIDRCMPTWHELATAASLNILFCRPELIYSAGYVFSNLSNMTDSWSTTLVSSTGG